MRVQLTIGMACYNDFPGVWATVQALRLCHGDVMAECELLVVDNCPTSTDGQRTAQLVTSCPNGRYIPLPEPVGTTPPRNMVFAAARGHAVLCMDCHVLFEPGALRKLLNWYAANPDTPDLVSGPMLYDDLRHVSTHFDDVWRGEMWGTWGTDERGKDPTGEPFEIFAQGLGSFSCRRDAWLGFNSLFRGFGGEECYVHTKYRQAGARCLCLPFLRWTHRFGCGRPAYPLTRWNKIRNYVLGHLELGLPLDRVHEHFVAGGLMPTREWAALVACPESELPRL